MGKKLVIVESPAKAKTINRILGRDYVVKSSLGHVRDLPERKLGVNVEKGFEPRYVLAKGKRKVVDELRKAALESDAVYLAPDPDREGEAIAWHLQSVLQDKAKDTPFYRVQYNEITPRAVKEAFAHPGEIDRQRVDAQQARRILDRLVGYTVSPMLWRRIKRGLSAGRVQSVALRLVCEREKEIRAFVPEEFWVLGATVRKLIVPLTPFDIRLSRIEGEKPEIKTESQAEAIKKELADRRLVVRQVTNKTVKKRPAPPFITSTLQQAASNRFQFSPSRTMTLAQRLYEGRDTGQGIVGLITYMRTDSVALSRDAVDACRDYLKEHVGGEYVPDKPNVYRSRSGAQEAHEAIRPTDVNRTPQSLKKRLEPAEWKLYALIWERFVASQMTPATIEQRLIEIDAPPAEGQEGRSFLFRASDSRVTFPGYMKIAGSDARQGNEDDGKPEAELPPLKEGEPLMCLEWLGERKETTPPPRYSEATLVRELERNGVGRPSTYAQILSTLGQRHYVTRQKRSLAATELGLQVNDLLSGALDELFNVTFTASMEDALDDVEEGRQNWQDMLGAFHERFAKWMEATKAPGADRATVKRYLDALESVTEWAPEVQRGRRTYSDERFVQSIRHDVEHSDKDISPRQFDALVRIACLYHDQSPDIRKVLEETGHADLLKSPEYQPPRESTVRKLELLQAVEMDDSARNFVDSLRSRVKGNRSLTQAQLKALNNVVLSHGDQIPDLEQRRQELEIEGSEVEQDNESGPLLDALKQVAAWKEPVVRGKRVYNDETFFASLRKHFETKGFLSVRQRAALKKMIPRYADQIENYEELAREHDLRKPKQKRSPRQAAGDGN